MTGARRSFARPATWAAAALLVAALLAGSRLVMGARWIRSPYPEAGRELAWALGTPGSAYNFAEVVPGRVFRSSRPDPRFLDWLVREYGIRRIVGLAGREAIHDEAERRGIRVTTYRWSVSSLPSREELEAVSRILDEGEPVLVHCASGSDRTGYALAYYRVTRLGWSLADAVREMKRFWHEPDRFPELHRELAAGLD